MMTPSPLPGSYDLMTPCMAVQASAGLDDLARLDAAGADVEPLRGLADQGANTLDVRVPAALGATVRVRHGHAPRRALATHFTNCCHEISFDEPGVTRRSAGTHYQRPAG